MSSHLLPCPSCARHVRSTAAECPFCQRPLALIEALDVAATGLRVSRAVGFFLGASLAASSALALQSCAVYGAPPGPTDASVDGSVDATVDASTDAAPVDDGSPGVRYGAPPPDR